MFRLLRPTLFAYDADADGAGGGQTTVITDLPKELEGKYIPIDKHNGTVGAFKQAAATANATAERLANEKSVLESQVADLTTKMSQFQTEAQKAQELGTKVSEFETNLKAQQELNARLEAAMKYPGLLDESTMALVKNSTLDAAALDQHLGKLAERLGSKTADFKSGESPAKPNQTELKPNDLMTEAETLRRKGDVKGFEAKMAEALATMDAKERFAPPMRPEV